MAKPKSNINVATAKLRSMVWAASEGELLGSEEELTATLEVSRPTIRQIARLLEAEGLLTVRRGIRGGYFASRPSVEVVEAAVSAYLETVAKNDDELAEITSALWIIVVRRAANLSSASTSGTLQSLRRKINKLSDSASFTEMWKIEESSRTELFKLVDSPYIELIFHINRTYSTKHHQIPVDLENTSEKHARYIRAWKNAKLLELNAIADHDPELAELAARHTRKLFHKRVMGEPSPE